MEIASRHSYQRHQRLIDFLQLETNDYVYVHSFCLTFSYPLGEISLPHINFFQSLLTHSLFSEFEIFAVP